MHTELRIDVEVIEGGFIVSTAGHGKARSRTHAATVADVSAMISERVTTWDSHNTENADAERGDVIERAGIIA